MDFDLGDDFDFGDLLLDQASAFDGNPQSFHQPQPQQQPQQHGFRAQLPQQQPGFPVPAPPPPVPGIGCEKNPALGLRVLLVDDDAVVLRVLEQMLRLCQYTVTSCTSGTSAVVLLRSQPDNFDLVLCDVMMPDMDGFKLLEIVGLEMDLPVIMISGNGDTETVLRGVTHGAVDFLIKPVRIEELRNMWQHVMRWRLEGEPFGLDSSDDDLSVGDEEPPLGQPPLGPDPLALPMDIPPVPTPLIPPTIPSQLPGYPAPPPPMVEDPSLQQPELFSQQEQQQPQQQLQHPQQHNSHLPIAPPPPPPSDSSKSKKSKSGKSSKISHKKRKDSESIEEGSVSKKPRVIWSVEMHQQFVNAVNQLGVDKAVPRKILDLMDIGGLTRENVASHLQKYRLYLKKVDGNDPNDPPEQFQH